MALVDWYELRHGQTLAGQQLLNVYHAQRLGGLITAFEIATAFIDWVLPFVLALESVNVAGTTLVVQNLGTPTDFVEFNIAATVGTLTGEVEPTFVAPRAQFLRERTDMKHGWKRIPGVTELHVTTNSLSAAYITALQNYASQVVLPWETAASPGVDVARFGVIARVCAEFDALGVCISYRLPENDGELQFYLPDQGLARTTVGSQTTRKLGSGN